MTPKIERARKALLEGFRVEGREVGGATGGGGESGRRPYRDGAGPTGGAPSAERGAEILRHGPVPPSVPTRSPSGWRSFLVTVPGIAFAFLPKLACPACWPAYAGLLVSVGLGFLLEATYLFALMAVFLALAVGALAFRARRRTGYGPFALGLAASGMVLVGKFTFGSDAAVYGGIGLLVAASLWKAWPEPNSNAGPCPKCVQQGPAMEARNAREGRS